MATTTEADIMPVGVVYQEPERGSYVKNCYSLPPDTWKVREGFGRVYSHNTSYNLVSKNVSLNSENRGYYKQLGSCSFTTSFGNRQILSLFIAQISVLNRDGADGNTNQGEGNIYQVDDYVVIPEQTYQYVVVIYDIDTNRHYEQVIGGKTSEIEDFIPMEQQLGFYDRDLIQQTHTKVFPINPEIEDPFYWAELNSPTLGDVIYFGTQQLGLYAYRPVVFDAPPDTQVETTFLGAYSYTLGGMAGRIGWSESGFIEKCSAGEGLLVGGFVYLNQSEFPVPTDITAINNRIAMAYGRSIYFSDTFNGSAIIADNILSIPTDNPITAISEINGVLLIFTKSETFMYQPSVGSEIQTSGRTIKINSNFGCLNSQAKMKVENLLYFCDDTGIYVSDGSSLSDIADPIRPLFRRFIEEPLTYYDRDDEQGYSNLSNPQPKIYYDWKKLKGLHFAKNPINSLVYVVVPEQKMSWVIDAAKMFSIWSWDTTITQKETPTTWSFTQYSVLQDDFRLVDNGDDLFIINLERQVQDTGALVLNEVESRVFYNNRTNNIYRWKVAGGTDFSISYHEDKKIYAKQAVILNEPATKDFQLVLGKPVEIYDGIWGDNDSVYAFNNSPLPNTPLYAVPVGIATTQRQTINSFKADIEFNNQYWEIETFTNAGFANYCSVIWHPNRLASADNFGWTIPVVATNIIRVFNNNELQIRYDGSYVPTYFGNYLNVLHQVQPLFWLIMRPRNYSLKNTMGVGWTLNSIEVNGVANNCVVIAEEFGAYERDWTTQENVEEVIVRQGSYPIEWILQSTPQQGEEGEIIKARGGFLNVFSNGPYPNKANLGTGIEEWVSDRGLINAMITSDYNNYQGQVIDWTMTPPSINDGLVNSEEGLVNVIDVSQGEFTNVVNQNQPKIFGNPSATYANLNYVPPQTLGGTILIDGEDYYPTSFSTGTKGTSFYITLYGYCQSIATKLLINKLRSSFRVVSDARRRWRSDRGAQ